MLHLKEFFWKLKVSNSLLLLAPFIICVALLVSAVAPPIVNVSSDTEGFVNLFSSHTFRCDVRIIEAVDIPYTVDI